MLDRPSSFRYLLASQPQKIFPPFGVFGLVGGLGEQGDGGVGGALGGSVHHDGLPRWTWFPLEDVLFNDDVMQEGV